MYNFNYKSDKLIGRVCYELSLKPFKSFEHEDITVVCEKLFNMWRDLSDKSESIALMLWTADGSEILDYSGELDDEFDYCDLIGIGNPTKQPPYTDAEKNDLHIRPVPYLESRRKISYRKLKEIILELKRVGNKLTGKDITVIETFDPGPEFAKSEFKYVRHPEICKGDNMGANQWLHCASLLHAEKRKYAGYPDGIKESTHFGEFLGRQFRCLARDVGFDSIWLSNGFGFSLDSWSWKGEVFDGEKFDTAGLSAVRDSINGFWHHFTAEVGDMLIETRGSNLSAAMDISAHGCPIDDIYKNNILTPPNSPWAALDSRFGLEICGYLSHIANISQAGYLFRYYIHDPWWYNSPWFDRYGRNPHDIYLPLSLARLDENGEVTKPYGINLLSVDDSIGNMPEKAPIEVIPHLLEAFDTYSDKAGLVTWIYPFDDYCEMGLRRNRPQDILMDDWFMESAIDYGFPVNTVISEKSFLGAPVERFKETVLVAPVPFKNSLLENCIVKAVENNLPVILYGNTEKTSDKVRELIGVRCTSAIDGELSVKTDIIKDRYSDGEISKTLIHLSNVSGGGICETADSADVLVRVEKDSEYRTYATFNKYTNIAWVRGSFPHKPMYRMPPNRLACESFPSGILMRNMLEVFDINIYFDAMYPTDKLPLTLYSRSNGAYYFTNFSKDTSVTMNVSLKQGVPMPCPSSAVIENNIGKQTLSTWSHNECRLFVRQTERSKVSCKYVTAGDTMLTDKRMMITGLKNADVTFFPPEASVVAFSDAEYAKIDTYFPPDRVNSDGSVTVINHSGALCVMWQDKATKGKYEQNGYII